MMKERAILNICPEEEFFGREKEIDQICSRALSEGPVSSIYLCGGRKTGKTEILKRVYHRLFWSQDKVVPFYYSVRANYTDPSGFAEDYLTSFVRQYLAFLKKDPLLAVERLPLSRLERMAAEEDVAGLTRLLAFHREGCSDRNHDVVLKNAISAPHLISLYYQPYYQTRVFVILDDFHLIYENQFLDGKTGALNEYPELLRSQLAPHLITGNNPAMPGYLFEGVDLNLFEVTGLDNEKAVQMLEGLCRSHSIKYDEDVLSYAAMQLDGNPFYIRSLIRASQKMRAGLASLKEFMDVYSYEVMKGGIAYHLSSLLSSMPDGKDRMARLRVLRTGLGLDRGISPEDLAERSGVGRDDLQNLLKGMHSLGLTDTGSGMVKWAGDKVLTDFVDAVYGIEVKGMPPSQVRTELIKKGLKNGFRLQSAHARVNIIDDLKEAMERFNGHKVPRVIFQNHDFISRYGSAGSEIAWTDEEETVSLPQIIGCYEGQRNDPGPYLLQAQGFYGGRYEEQYESVWVAGVKDSSEAVTADDVEEFIARCNSLKEKVRSANTVRWLIGRGGFDTDSSKILAGEGIYFSDYNQFRLLQRLMESSDGRKSFTGLMPLREFELLIPMAEDAELVAAGALEEVARKAGFDDDTVSQVKMAVIEACINAFEHSRVKDGKVSIKIFVERDRMVVYVQNEGRVFDVSVVPRPDIDTKINSPDKRGWGIELMKGLMDEVSFENVEGGTKLVMVKYIKERQEEAASVRGLKVVQNAS